MLEGKQDIVSYAFLARSMPMLSTRSSVSRRPAVSAMITGIPSISRDSSNMSLVVPGRGVTMAASRWAISEIRGKHPNAQ